MGNGGGLNVTNTGAGLIAQAGNTGAEISMQFCKAYGGNITVGNNFLPRNHVPVGQEFNFTTVDVNDLRPILLWSGVQTSSNGKIEIIFNVLTGKNFYDYSFIIVTYGNGSNYRSCLCCSKIEQNEYSGQDMVYFPSAPSTTIGAGIRIVLIRRQSAQSLVFDSSSTSSNWKITKIYGVK